MEINPPSPALTVIMLMPGPFERLANSLAHLQRQTVHEQIELILVHTPGSAREIAPECFAGFHSFRSVQFDQEFSPSAAFAAGFREGTAPVVAYIEDHVAINPGWAEAILAAHQGPWSAVAPAMESGNHAGSWIGLANFLMCFADWFGYDQRCGIESGPGHNTTYKRAALEPHLERLADLYRSERNLCYLLESEGCKMAVEPRAITQHINISKFYPALAQAYCGGAIFGTHRAGSMKGIEKVGRTLLSPLVPPLRLWRILNILISRGKYATSGVTPALPFLFLSLVLHAAGEVAGYWGDASSVEPLYLDFELNRSGCVDDIDRALLLSSQPPLLEQCPQ